MRIKMQVAHLTLTYTYTYDDYLKKSPLLYQIQDSLDTTYDLSVHISSDIEPYPFTPQTVIKNRAYYLDETFEIIEVIVDGKVSQRILFNKHEKRATISLNNKLVKDLAVQEYVLSSMLFLEFALMEGFIPLHASAIDYKGDAVLFSAPSGTGKSTHANYWKKLFADDVKFINDDKPLIYKNNEHKFMVTGSPFSGKSSLNQNIQSNLKAIVFIKQGTSNQVQKLNSKDAFQYLMQNILRPNDQSIWENLFGLFNQLIEEIPIYTLEATHDINAAQILHQHLYGGSK